MRPFAIQNIVLNGTQNEVYENIEEDKLKKKKRKKQISTDDSLHLRQILFQTMGNSII